MNETLVSVTGNVITDVTMRRTGDGTKVVSFRLATNERRFDRTTEKWVDGDKLYLTVTCWRRLADGVVSSLTKGDPVIVTGRLYTRGYEVEGVKRSVTELDAHAVGPDLNRCFAELRRPRRAASEDVGPESATVDGGAAPEAGPAVPSQADSAGASGALGTREVGGERSLTAVGGA